MRWASSHRACMPRVHRWPGWWQQQEVPVPRHPIHLQLLLLLPLLLVLPLLLAVMVLQPCGQQGLGRWVPSVVWFQRVTMEVQRRECSWLNVHVHTRKREVPQGGHVHRVCAMHREQHVRVLLGLQTARQWHSPVAGAASGVGQSVVVDL